MNTLSSQSQFFKTPYNSDLICPVPIQCDNLNIIEPVDPFNISFSEEKCIKKTNTPSTQSPNLDSSIKKQKNDFIFIQNWQDKIDISQQKKEIKKSISVVRNPKQLFGSVSNSYSKQKITQLDFRPFQNHMLTNLNTQKCLQKGYLLRKKKKSPIQQKKYYSLKRSSSEFKKKYVGEDFKSKMCFTDKKNKQNLWENISYQSALKIIKSQKYISLKGIQFSQNKNQLLNHILKRKLDRYDTNLIDLRMRNLQKLKEGLRHQMPIGKFGSHLHQIQRLDSLLNRVNSQLHKTERNI